VDVNKEAICQQISSKARHGYTTSKRMLASCWLPEVAIPNENHNAYISSTQTVVMAFNPNRKGLHNCWANESRGWCLVLKSVANEMKVEVTSLVTLKVAKFTTNHHDHTNSKIYTECAPIWSNMERKAGRFMMVLLDEMVLQNV
jgi:hypothetical protein